MPGGNCTPSPEEVEGANQQVVDSTRKIPRRKIRTLLPVEVRESIFAMLMIHMVGVRRTARHHGLLEAEVEEVLFDEMTRRMDKAVRLAYQNGQRSMMPPCPGGEKVA